MLRLATFFFGFLEGRKIYELRTQKFDISKCEISWEQAKAISTRLQTSGDQK
jgi:hypothetical protein